MVDKKMMTVVPPEAVPTPPYANVTYTFVNTGHDMTIVFMRVPLLTAEAAEKLHKAPGNTLEGEIVSSVTLPMAVANDLADAMKGLTQKALLPFGLP